MIGAELVLYTEGHRITGTVATGAQRLSDFLNDPKTELLDVQQARYQEMTMLAEPVSASHLIVRKEQVLLVVPLDTPGPGGRVQTQQVHVHLGCPLFGLEGNLHKRPSDPTSLSAFIADSSRTFIPLSEARISYLASRDFDTEVSVVLIHAARIQFWSADQNSQGLRLVF